MTSPKLVESVLHPTDFSAGSERAFAHALAIALLRGTEFTILHVTEQNSAKHELTGFPAVRGTLERWGLLEPGSPREAVFDELGVSVRKTELSNRFTALAIANYLDQNPVDLMVLATEGGSGVARWLQGSTAERVSRWTRTMTLFVPVNAERDIVALDGELTLRNVLVPVDRSPDPVNAIEFARRAADVVGDGDVTITLLHVGDGDYVPGVSVADGPGWTFRREHRSGDPVDVILEVAATLEADLIVMPTAGRHGAFDALRGSTTERVLRRASCPLLAVPAPDNR